MGISISDVYCIYEDEVNNVVFFFKQKTAYGMRISDWSSDVCSSDLHAPMREIGEGDEGARRDAQQLVQHAVGRARGLQRLAQNRIVEAARSEERRVGKEWVSSR